MPGRPTLKIRKTSSLITIVAVFIFVIAGWFWWHSVYMSSDNVFWGMVNNNLTTNSVTRHVIQTQDNRSVDQYIRVQFGAINASETSVTLKQSDATGQSIVKSESIGTAENDYSRYVSIQTPQKTSDGKPINTGKVVGIWGKTETAKAGQPASTQYFQQSVLTIVPYGSFSQSQRQKLVEQMRDQDVYNLTAGPVKSQKQNGRSVFVYSIKVKPAAYVQLMQTYAKELGLGDIGLDPSTYAGSPLLNLELTIDKLSRQITKINYPDSGQSETVVDQNIFQPIKLPTQTIPINDLQDRIQKLGA